MCTEESYPNIKHSVEQFKIIAIKIHDGIQTVLKTIIKVSDHLGITLLKSITFSYILYRRSMLMDTVLCIVGRLLRAGGYVKLFGSVLM